MNKSDAAAEGVDDQGLSRRLGDLVRKLRNQHGLSLRALAAKADLSSGLICELEQGRVKPTVRTLLKLADALGVRADLFLGAVAGSGGLGAELPSGRAPDARPGAPTVMRRGDRSKMTLANGLKWEGLVPGVTPGCSFVQLELPPGGTADDQLLTHEGSEFGLILSGSMQVELDGKVHELEQGDCIYFDSSIPHRLSNPGDVPLAVLWVNFGTAATPAAGGAFNLSNDGQ